MITTFRLLNSVSVIGVFNAQRRLDEVSDTATISFHLRQKINRSSTTPVALHMLASKLALILIVGAIIGSLVGVLLGRAKAVIAIAREGKVEVFADSTLEVARHHDISSGLGCILIFFLPRTNVVVFIILILILILIFFIVAEDRVAILILKLVTGGRHIAVHLFFLITQLNVQPCALAFAECQAWLVSCRGWMRL